MKDVTKQMKNAELDDYFDSTAFTARLDEIRDKTSDPLELKAIAFEIAAKLELKLDHVNIISDYLITGKYTKLTYSNFAVKSFGRDIEKGQIIPSANNTFGVYLDIPEDATKDDALSFIEKNWQTIRSQLDRTYPARKKRFEEVRRLNDYITIADKLNVITNKREHALKAKELATKYNMEPSDINKIANKYRSILMD